MPDWLVLTLPLSNGQARSYSEESIVGRVWRGAPKFLLNIVGDFALEKNLKYGVKICRFWCILTAIKSVVLVDD